MDALTDQYGFDERIFMSEVPEYFHCTVCSLVLRNPIQILHCGHKMCAVCFDRIRTQSQTSNAQLMCPIDRNLVDMTGVCEDIYLKRVIGNLVVRCHEHEQGCEWTGDLRELCNHVDLCPYKPLQQQSGDTESFRVRDLTNRLEQCESSLFVKDKEIAMLKDLVQELQQSNAEMQSLKQQQQQKHESLELQISQFARKSVELEERLHQQQQQHKEMQRRQQQHEIVQQRHYEELQQQQQQHEEVKLQLQHEMGDLQGINERQQEEINSFMSMIETLQRDKGIALCANRDHNIPSTSQVVSGGDTATVQMEQPIIIQKKDIVVEVHSGDPRHVTISNNEHSVQFRSTVNVSARNAVIPEGSKVWYEVSCARTTSYLMCVGWATSNLPFLQKVSSNDWLGEDSNGYAFSVFLSLKSHCGSDNEWGKPVLTNSVVVGVVLDLVKREILFSMNGQWAAPMGVAFSGLPADTELFPAFTGTHGTSLQYNFGDHDFTFGPPDPTFLKLIDVID